MKKIALAGLLAAAALAPAVAAAQMGMTPLSVEVRMDAGIPVGDSKDRLKTGVGFTATGAFNVTPLFAVYGGFSQFDFDHKTLDVEVTEKGWELGGKASFGTGGGLAMPFIQMGALFRDGDTGLVAGGGFDYSVGGNVSVVPAVTYRKTDAVDQITAGLGVRIRL